MIVFTLEMNVGVFIVHHEISQPMVWSTRCVHGSRRLPQLRVAPQQVESTAQDLLWKKQTTSTHRLELCKQQQTQASNIHSQAYTVDMKVQISAQIVAQSVDWYLDRCSYRI